MTDLDMWTAVVGAGMPALIAVVVRGKWPSWARAVAALGSCIIAGLLTAYLNGGLHGVNPIRAVLVTAFAAFGAYRLWWQPSGIAPAIEKATDPTPAYTGRYGRQDTL